LTLSPTLRLWGPYDPTDERWRAADMPPDAVACYVASTRSRAQPGPAPTLIIALHRRLGGWWRYHRRDEWRPGKPDRQVRDLSVFAAEVLAPEDVLRLLASHMPGLHVSESEPDRYALESARVSLEMDQWPPGLYDDPWILAQPWYRRTGDVVEYELSAHDDDDQQARRQIQHAARTLAEATHGIILDDMGFPWHESMVK
jgi:hypothetical protein